MTLPLQIINDGAYTLEHVAQMRDALKAAQIQQPVTFPVRAGLLTSSESQKSILWLLEEVPYMSGYLHFPVQRKQL